MFHLWQLILNLLKAQAYPLISIRRVLIQVYVSVHLDFLVLLLICVQVVIQNSLNSVDMADDIGSINSSILAADANNESTDSIVCFLFLILIF